MRVEPLQPESTGPGEFDVHMAVRVVLEEGDTLEDVMGYARVYLRQHDATFEKAPTYVQEYMAETLARYALRQLEEKGT